VLLFRDGFRVFPYGEDEDDWLALDRKALGRSGYTLNKTQFIGRSIISRTKNQFLIDQTNREGLRHTAEREVFVGVLQFAITQLMFNFLKEMDQQYKFQKVDLSEAKEEITTLEKRAASAIKRLKKVIPKGESSSLEEIEQTFFELMDFSEKARKRITEVEQESRQMIELAGVGMMVEVVAHELARASENALDNLEKLRKKSVPSDIRQTLESLRAQMKSLSKRVRILDPLSISGRQRAETFDLEQLIVETFSAHEGQFARHCIDFDFVPCERPVFVRAVRGMIVQILENLISNSKYWLEMKRNRDQRFIPKIQIALQANPPSVLYSDNGGGIAPENKERIFKPFFSLKEKSKRRGLGLFIARECAEHNGASLFISEEMDPVDKRLHQFILEFPITSK
jgi:signal transduction histidine kinase